MAVIELTTYRQYPFERGEGFPLCIAELVLMEVPELGVRKKLVDRL